MKSVYLSGFAVMGNLMDFYKKSPGAAAMYLSRSWKLEGCHVYAIPDRIFREQ